MKNYVKDYPRPQFIRNNWQNLNGIWELKFDDKNCGEQEKWYIEFEKHTQIQVPFTYETKLSRIQEETRHDYIWYRKVITVDAAKLANNNLFLHFEGSDYITKVWINGAFCGIHKGGYSRFSFDITNLVKDGNNTITVKVEDSYDLEQTRGKQRWKPNNFGCWYVQTTGIWKTVWLEYVPKTSIFSIKMTPILAENALELEADICSDYLGQDLLLEVVISFEDIVINKAVFSVLEKHITAKMEVSSQNASEWGIKTWSPKHPDLYDITFRLILDGKECDYVRSYFGMRDIRIENGSILLNGIPIYQRLILYQGYWKDSHLTPPSEEALIEDIDKIKLLGYNGLRIHQKVEDERFLYWCDRKGMLVWSEMAAFYQFTDRAVQEFTSEWMDIVKQNYNHPCIITWTPFNESWGIPQVKLNKQQQNFTEAIYYLTKTFDKNRPVIVNDGWEHTVSDIITLHDYEQDGQILFERYKAYIEKILTGEVFHNRFRSAFAKDYCYKGQPIIISEFGGIAFNNGNGWGYGDKVNTEEEFLQRFDSIVSAIKKLPYVCGYCYTQATDVQQEINGLMDMNRNFKVNPEAIRKINERPNSIHP